VTWEVLRTVVEELDVADQVDLLSEKHARFSQAWDGIKWILARTPDLPGAFRKLGATQNYRLISFAGSDLADTPDIWVVYRFTENEVTLLGVMTSPRAESDP
jgi:hypothetical protein